MDFTKIYTNKSCLPADLPIKAWRTLETRLFVQGFPTDNPDLNAIPPPSAQGSAIVVVVVVEVV